MKPVKLFGKRWSSDILADALRKHVSPALFTRVDKATEEPVIDRVWSARDNIRNTLVRNL